MRVHPQGTWRSGASARALYRTLRGRPSASCRRPGAGRCALERLRARHLLWAGAGLAVLVLAGLFLLLQSAVNRALRCDVRGFHRGAPNTPPSLRAGPPGPATARSPQGAEPPGRQPAPDAQAGDRRRNPRRRAERQRRQPCASAMPACSRAAAPRSHRPTPRCSADRQAVRGEDVSVQVIGHTDNVPIRPCASPRTMNCRSPGRRRWRRSGALDRHRRDPRRGARRGPAGAPERQPRQHRLQQHPEGRTQNRAPNW